MASQLFATDEVIRLPPTEEQRLRPLPLVESSPTPHGAPSQRPSAAKRPRTENKQRWGDSIDISYSDIVLEIAARELVHSCEGLKEVLISTPVHVFSNLFAVDEEGYFVVPTKIQDSFSPYIDAALPEIEKKIKQALEACSPMAKVDDLIRKAEERAAQKGPTSPFSR